MSTLSAYSLGSDISPNEIGVTLTPTSRTRKSREMMKSMDSTSPEEFDSTPQQDSQKDFLSPPRSRESSLVNENAEGFAYQPLSLQNADMDQISNDLQALSFNENGKARPMTYGPHSSPVLMLEITDTGENYFKYMRLRELLDYVNGEAKRLDKIGDGFGFPLAARADFGNSDGQSAKPSNNGREEAFCSAANPLRLRDLRRLEGQSNVGMSGGDACVLVRWHCVLVSLEPIRAIVMSNRIILMVPDGADTLLSTLEEHMLSWVDSYGSRLKAFPTGTASSSSSSLSKAETELAGSSSAKVEDPALPSGHSSSSTLGYDSKASPTVDTSGRLQSDGFMPFEAHVLDALLTMASSLNDQEFKLINMEVQAILKQFQQAGCILSIEEQESMRRLKNQMSHISNRLKAFERALDDVVHDDEAMALMNLSLLRMKPKLYEFPLTKEILGTHEEIEELLEAYLNDYNSTDAKLQYLKSQMQSAEELVSLRLDTARNQLLVANTAFAVLACAISTGSYITGAFGMNLDNTLTLQNERGLFHAVVLSSAAGIILIFLSVICYLRYTGVLPTTTVANKI